MKKLISTTLLSACLLLVAQAQEKITFKLNPEIGKSLPFEMNMKTDMEGPQNVMMEMKMKMNLVATDVTDKDATYETKYAAIKTDVDAGLLIINYDSSREPANEMEEVFAAQMKPMLESTLTMKLDRHGKLLDFSFPNVSAQAFDKSSLQGMALAYPTYPIAIGDSWDTESELTQLKIKGKVKNTLTEKTAQGYKIAVVTEYKDESGLPIGTSDGYYIIDPTTHYTTYSSNTTQLEMQGAKIITSLEVKEIK